MNIASIQGFRFQNNTRLNSFSRANISFGDIDYDRIDLNEKSKPEPRKIAIMTPYYDMLEAQFKIHRSSANNIYETQGRALMQEGYSMKFRAKQIQNDAQELAQKSKEKFDEGMELFKDAKEHNFKEYRNQDHSEYWSRREVEKTAGATIITEYDDDDESEVLRRVKITSDKMILEDVRYFSGLVDEYVFDLESQQLLEATFGKSEFVRGGYKAEKSYSYSYEGELLQYFIDFKTTRNADISAGEYFIFNPEYIEQYYQGYSAGGDKFTTSADKNLTFEDGQCTGANIGLKDVDGGEKSISREFFFDTHGNIDSIAINLKEKTNGLTTAPTIYTFEKGILNHAYKDYKAFEANGTASAKKVFTFYLGTFGPCKIGSCELNGKGLIGKKHQIQNCMSEKIAEFYRG